MFRVGDKVIRLDVEAPYVYTIQNIEDGVITFGRKVKHKTLGWWLQYDEVRKATPEEVLINRRIGE